MNDSNGHIFDDSPDEYLGHLAAIMEAHDGAATFCDLCYGKKAEVIPASGSRWVVGFTHSDDCPNADPPLKPPRYDEDTTE